MRQEIKIEVICLFTAISITYINFIYCVSSGGKTLPAFSEPVSKTVASNKSVISAEDKVYEIMKAHYKNAETIEVHYSFQK